MVPHTTRLPVSDPLVRRLLAVAVVELNLSAAGRQPDRAHQVAAVGLAAMRQHYEERAA